MAKKVRGSGATAQIRDAWPGQSTVKVGRTGRNLAWSSSPIAGKEALKDLNKRQAALGKGSGGSGKGVRHRPAGSPRGGQFF